jgi:adenylosuccinate synthase
MAPIAAELQPDVPVKIELALTKLDVLSHFAELPVCVRYRTPDGGETRDFPAHQSDFHAAEPVYETLPGWTSPTRGVRRYEDLPDAARAYVRRLEEVSGVPAAIISTGSDRDETILRTDSVLSRWFGG